MACLFKNPFAKTPRSAARTVDVGWALTEDKASLIWDDPAPFRRDLPKAASAKSVQVCPAAIDFDARHFVVPCPVDVHLRIARDEKGNPGFVNVDAHKSSIRPKHLGQMAVMMNRAEWRHPDRPIIQFVTPYIFLSDEPVWINQLPTYLEYTPDLPGTLIAGRFPIDVWPRPMMWAFEWHDTSRDIILRRGRPWFYLRFETENPAASVRLRQCELTLEVRQYVDSLTGVTNYVNRTFSLFDRARARRPKTLLVPRGDAQS